MHKSTAEAKTTAKTRRNQPKSRNEVATESRSRDKKLFVQLIPGYDISRTSLEEEIEGLFKRSHDLKFKWRPEMTKATIDKGYDQEGVVEIKGINQGRILGCNTTLMSRRRLKTIEVVTLI